jgi:phosphatidate cytidylyltransferase
MLSHRLITGLSLIALFLAVLLIDERWFAPWYPLWFLYTGFFLVLAAYEVCGLLAAAGACPSVNAVVGGVAVLVLANWLPHICEGLFGQPPEHSQPARRAVETMAWPLWAFTGAVMAAFLAQGVQFVRPGRTTATLAGTVLAIAYIGLLGSFIVQMRWLDGPYHGVIPLAATFAAAKGADTGAYTFGRLAGRRKLWPRLSPNKTVEGALGGVVFAVAAALVVFGIARALKAPTLSWPAAIGFGLLVGIAAQLGDLMESMLKRDGERKDASDTLPGFGGVLDVLDSLLFAGPVAYGHWLLFGP